MLSSNAMPASWGNISPFVKEPIPHGTWKAFPMAKQRVPPRTRLARNLRAMLNLQGLSPITVADHAKIDRKSMNNLLNARFDPRLSLVEKVANVFGMTTWQLLATDMEVRPPATTQVVELLEHYTKADDDGRKAVMQIAQMAASKSGT